MKLLCKHYTNTTRLAAGVSAFCEESGFRFFCLEGTIIKNKNQFKVVSERITVCVSFISQQTHKGAMVLLSNNPKYKEFSGSYVDVSICTTNNVFSDLCSLLSDKYVKTFNAFKIFFSGDSMVVEVRPVQEGNSAVLQCVLHTVAGDAIVESPQAITEILSSCEDIREFSYVTVTPDVERTVDIKKPRGEIYKEIAHYLSKTLVLVSFSEDRLVEHYINVSGILEVSTKADGTKAYKRIPPLTMRNYNPFCIYLTSASIEDIAKEQGRGLRK